MLFIIVFQAHMIQDTAMKFVGQGAGSSLSSTGPQSTLETIHHLTSRFLMPSHQLIVELKMRFLQQMEEYHNDPGEAADQRAGLEEKAAQFIADLLVLATIVTPGQTKLRGILINRGS